MNWIQKQKNIYIYLFITILVVASFVLLSFWQRSIHNQVKADVEAATFSVTLNTPDANTDLVATTGSVTAGSTLGYGWTYEESLFMPLNMPFDNGATVSDIGGDDNDGTITGATFTTSGCQVGGCFTFDGNDSIDIADDDDLTFLSGSSDDLPFSISLWFSTTTDSGTYGLVAKSTSATNGEYYLIQNNATLIMRAVDENSGGYIGQVTGNVISTDTLYHVVATYDGSNTAGGFTIYLDGSSLVTSSSSGGAYGAMENTTKTLTIGKRANFFNGTIDEVQIYNQELAAEQVSQLYADQNAGIGGPTEIVQQQHADQDLWGLSVYEITSAGAIDSSGTFIGNRVITSSTSVLDSADFSFNSPTEAINVDPNFTAPGGFTGSLGYQWLVDGSPYANLNMPFNSGSTQRDVSGNTLNSALNTTTFTTTGCKVGGCISLDGAADYVGIVGDTTTFNFIQNTGIFSISAWIKIDNPDDSYGPTIFATSAATAEKGAYFAYNNGVASADNELRVFIPNAGSTIIDSRSADNSITDTNWHHVVATGDATNVFFYVDSVKQTGSGTMGAKASGNSTRSANIGRYPYSTPGGYFNGMIDEVMVFDHQLSDAQVTQIYNDTNAGNAGPSEIVPAEHNISEVWRLDVFEFNSSGITTQEFTAGSATVATAAVTTLDITQPSGTQSNDITIAFTCSNADDEARDLLVEYSENSGGAFSNATISSPSSGSVNGSVIEGVTCDGTSQTIVWNSATDGLEGAQSDIQIRLTAQINAAPSDTTTDFSIDNPYDICDATGEASDDILTAAETSFDNSGILIDGCTFTITGSHSFTSLSLINSAVLNHTATTTTTEYSMNLTIAGDVSIESGSSINLDQRGYKGGQSDGAFGYTSGNSTTNGSSHRMGGAYGGQGGLGADGTQGIPYGDPVNPTEPGAGGGGRTLVGRDGGGLVRITSTGTITVSGTITANGGATSSASSGSGAGGGIYLNAATIAGSGTIQANGGNGDAFYGNGAGSGGRIALIYNDYTFNGTLVARGGTGNNSIRYGAAGTVYFEDKDTHTSGQGNLQILNAADIDTRVTPLASAEVFNDITIKQYGYLEASDFTVNGTLTIESGGVLRHDETTTSTIYSLAITAANVDVQSGGSIFMDEAGFKGGQGDGAFGYTTGNVTTNGSSHRMGGAHGGQGGNGADGSSGLTYGNPLNPTEPGAGGGGRTLVGRDGGGLLRITATGTVTIDGTISANGGEINTASSGSGAGGGIYINSTTLAGSGTIRANGGDGDSFYGSGAGGGGRIALIYTTKTFSGNIQAFGGVGNNSLRYGAAGTIYESATSTTFTVDNNGTNAPVDTPLCYTGGATSYSFTQVVVDNYGDLLIDSPCTCASNALTASNSITLDNNGTITDNLDCTSIPVPDITTTSLPLAPINTAYSQTVAGTGGYKAYTWSIVSGSLPTGLSLNSSTGVISGTPTVSESQTFTVRLTDNNPAGGTTDDQELTIVVNSTPTAPTTLYVGNGTAQSGSSNPTNISNPYFSAVYNDADVGDTSSQYRLQVYSDANASSLVWDSGLTAQTSCTAGNRCADIQYGGSAGSLIVGATYYWRILFVDSNSVSSPYSESAPLSNTFVYVSSGTSQTVQETRQTPNNPLALAPTIIDENTIEIEWIDRSTNEAGFRILNEFNEVIKEVPANTTSTTIENLPSNTSINGIKVVAYNSNGQSSPSQEYVEVVMPAPDVTPIVIEETETTVTLGINKLMNNLQEGKSGIEIEIKTSEGVQTSGWIRTQSHTFEIPEEEGIEVRVRARNQEGIETEWSDWYIIDQLELGGLLLSFSISSIGTTGVGAAALRQFDLDSKMKGVVKVSNNNEINVNNLFVNMVLPSKVNYIPGTLIVDGIGQTDAADEDYGQANSNAISMIVDELNGFTGMRLEFEFTFADVYKDAFRAKRIENSLELDTTESEQNTVNQIQSIIAQAISEDEVVALTVTASADGQDQVEITQEIAADEQAIVEEIQKSEGAPAPEEEQQTPEEEVNNEPPSQEEETEIQETIEEILEVIANPEPQPQNPPAPPSTIQPPSESGQTPSGQETQQGRPGIDSPGTNTSHGNGTFNVKTIGANGNTLSVSGSAIVSGNQIQFTGTASEPFSVVTVILNNNSTVIAVADRLGNWSTNVTAEQLGLQVGEEQTYEIELIAAKGDLRTDRVNIGRVKLLLKAIDELEAEFERLAKESTLETVLENIRMDVVEYIEKNEPEIQSTLGVTVPIVIASSAPLWGYIPMLPTLLYHALTYLIGYIGRKKKKERYYGVIYDAITKDPLSLVVIRIYDSATKKLAATTVSNKFGHYEVLLKDGNYYLEARKPQFVFPSHIVQSAQDGEYDHVYQSTGFTFSTAVPSLPDVPMDPLNYNAIWNKAKAMKVWYSIQRAGKFLAVPVLLAGSLASILLLSVSPLSTTNWILAIFYVAILFLQLRLRLVTKPAWGIVSDLQTNYLLGLAPIQLIDTNAGKIVKSRLTDYEGRYYFTPEPGQYQIKASKDGYKDTQADIKVKKKDERVAKDINMQHK